MRIVRSTDRHSMKRLLDSHQSADQRLMKRVARIIDRVRRGGDPALLGYARRFDGLRDPIELGPDQIRETAAQTSVEVRTAIRAAARHIRRVARAELPRSSRITVAPGVSVEHRITPLDRVGCYVPGGRTPLPSSLLMAAIPAQVAGVGEIIAVCSKPSPAVLAAAREAGVARFFQVGGAHAVAALAYGTRQVPRVDKIVGPGNRYVAAAKAMVASDCAIDLVAGPTEIIIVTGSGRADWIAADLIAQAEHDPDARAIFITWSARLARLVADRVRQQVPQTGPAAAALAANGAVILARSETEAIALADRAAPEHLVAGSERIARTVRHAGAVFVGLRTPVAAGDYATGSNHILPTDGWARRRGGLSAADFVRVTSVQRLSRSGLERLAPIVLTLAGVEGLRAHARSIEMRLA